MEHANGERKTVVILSERSREIIRLFEERQRKRQQTEHTTSLQPHSLAQLPIET